MKDFYQMVLGQVGVTTWDIFVVYVFCIFRRSNLWTNRKGFH